MSKLAADKFKIQGDMLTLAYSSLKDVLPLVTRYNKKTKYNSIILGKWQKKK